MNQIEVIQESKNKYKFEFNQVHLGDAERDIDGFFYFWFTKDNSGSWDAWVLREISIELDKLNEDLNRQINIYFHKNKI